MKAPLSWLREFVELECGAEELADRLTFSGLEVEGIAVHGAGLEAAVVGEILGIEPHPNADSLSVCLVHDGQREHRVVCGARNFTVGDKAAFARPGAELPGNRTIGVATIRGVASSGMLCAEDELGLSDDHSGILLLPRSARRGKPLSEIAGPPEPVLDIDVTPNRADCLSIIGIAREAAALFGKRLKTQSVELRESSESIKKKASVLVEDAAGSPRYTLRALYGMKVAQSPLWLRHRLIQCGIRPINNVVDITNYVMLETGQPLHAFDASLINGTSIIVRRARQGELITTLDETERELTDDMLVIADELGPVALAGVMGGASSGISASTDSVLLESACFDPPLIRRTSKALGLTSESSSRFEHGVDIMAVERASKRAAALLTELAGGAAAKGVIDFFPAEPKPRSVSCRFSSVFNLLGVEMPASRILSIFDSLELKVVEQNAETCLVQPPSFRMDIEREADLIEEVARIHGLDNIPTAASKCSIVSAADDSALRAAMLCKSRLAALGLMEIVNYSFISKSLLDLFQQEDRERRVSLPNPISSDQAILRDSLLPQMGETLKRNCARQNEEAALFEMGRVFFKNERGALAEEERFSIGIMGQIGRAGLDKGGFPSEEEVFLWMKGIFESFCGSMCIALENQPHRPASEQIGMKNIDGHSRAAQGFTTSCFEREKAALLILNGAVIGAFGLLKGDIRKEWRLRSPVALLEARVEPFLKPLFAYRSAKPIPAYPCVSRDLAIIVAKGVSHEEIVRTIWTIAPKELTDISLFDIYYGEELGADRKGMAYSFRYRSMDRTLTDEEVNDLHSAIKAGMKERLQTEFREA